LKRYPYETNEDVNSRFHRNLKMGRQWENYLMTALPHAYGRDYDVEHVQDILGFDTYRQNGNKYPDFRLTLHKNKRNNPHWPHRMYIDAKRKRGYTSREKPHDEFLTCDKSFLDSYSNVVQQDKDNGYNATGLLLFWHEKSGAYMAPLTPHNWLNFGANGYGSDLSGQYWIKLLKRMHQFDSFAEEITQNLDADDWADAFTIKQHNIECDPY